MVINLLCNFCQILKLGTLWPGGWWSLSATSSQTSALVSIGIKMSMLNNFVQNVFGMQNLGADVL
jgi:hypothetical protein